MRGDESHRRDMRPAGLPAAPPLQVGARGKIGCYAIAPMRSLAILPTRCVAATPTWTTSSTRPETPASCSVTTFGLRARVTLDGVAVATHDALEAGAGLLDVALELVARGGAAALVALLELLELTHGLLARAERVGHRAGGVEHAVARLERRADVGERGALDDRLALLGRGARGADVRLGGVTRLVARLRADATTSRARRRRGRRAAARGRLALASGRLLRGRRLLARPAWSPCGGGGVRGLSQPCGSSPPWVVRIFVRLRDSRRTYVRKPKSLDGLQRCADFVSGQRGRARKQAVKRLGLCADRNVGSTLRGLAQAGRLGAVAASPRGRCSSATVGSASGPDQTRLSPSIPARATTPSQNALPCSYWRSLRSMPSSLSSSFSSPERSWRRRRAPRAGRAGRRGRSRRRRPSRARRSPRARP